MTETKDCPKCEKKMIQRGTGFVYATYPPITPMIWWCGCGYTEDAPSKRGKTENEIIRELWEAANSLSGGGK